jgi:hypothetical protein
VHEVPGCVTVNVCPPIVRLPVRAVVLVFAAALKLTAPSPDPLAPAVTVIQGAPLDAIQAHPTPEVTAIDPTPPELATA